MARGLDASTAAGHPAYKLGLTSQGYRAWKSGGTPLGLAERSPGGISRAAQAMNRAAYAPAQGQINQQQQRVEALQAKREADNNAFAQWVQTRGDALRADAISQANATRDALVQGQASYVKSLQGVTDAANAQGAIGGADAQQIAAHQAAAAAGSQAQVNAGVAHVGEGTQLVEANIANNAGVVAASRASDLKGFLSSMQSVADLRSKLGLAQAADLSRTTQEMERQEVTKGQARLAAELGGAKLNAANQNAAAQRAVTRRGQDKTSGSAANRLAFDQGKVNQYGYTNSQWGSFTDQHRARIVQNFKAAGGKGGGKSQAKAVAKGAQTLASARQLLDGIIAPADTPKGQPPEKPPALGPRGPQGNNNVTNYSHYLQRHGVNRAVADYVAWAKGNPGKPQPQGNRQAYQTFVKSLGG